MRSKLTSYQHVLHSYRTVTGGKAAIVLTGHEHCVDVGSCGLCRRVLKAGFACYTRSEATATFGIDPCTAGSGPDGAIFLVSNDGHDGQAPIQSHIHGGTPFEPGCQ